MRCFVPSEIHYKLICTFGLLFFCLSGCAIVAAVPDNFVFPEEIRNIESLSKVKRIALLDVPPPSNIILGDYFSDSATFWFGTVGMLTVVDTEGKKVVSGDLVSETTQNALKTSLEQLGKEVILIQAEREDKSKMLESYEQFIQVDADAILEVAPIQVGFKFKQGELAFRKSKQEVSPEVFYKYRLVSVESGEVLVQSNILWTAFDYRNKPPFAGKRIEGLSSLRIENIEAVKHNKEEAISKLTRAIKEASMAISWIIVD